MLELIFIILALVVAGYCLVLVGRLVSFTLKSLFKLAMLLLTFSVMLAVIYVIVSQEVDPVLKTSFQGITLNPTQVKNIIISIVFMLLILIIFSKQSSSFKIFGSFAIILNALMTNYLFSSMYEPINPNLPNYPTDETSYNTLNVISQILYVYLISVNISTILFYGYDKFRAWIFPKPKEVNGVMQPARLNHWVQKLACWIENFAPWVKAQRVPEWILHWHSICGGSLAAAIAQQFFHHKSSKQSFRQVYYKTVLVQVIFLIALLYYKRTS